MKTTTLTAALVALLSASADAKKAANGDFVELVVHDVYSVHHQSNVVLLKTRQGARFLPIWIGSSEALAISMRLTRQHAPRPLTHDLVERVVGSLGARIAKIHIEDLKGHVFFGRIFLQRRGDTIEIDARPSDSIALAVGARAPIFAARKVLERAGVSEKDFRVKARPAPRMPEGRPEESL
jgi:hypothetical protein